MKYLQKKHHCAIISLVAGVSELLSAIPAVEYCCLAYHLEGFGGGGVLLPMTL